MASNANELFEQLIARANGGSRASSTDMLPGLAAFGIGVLVGAGVALLFAPASGDELRENISERLDDLKDSASQALGTQDDEAKVGLET